LFKKRMLRKILGPKMDKVTGEWGRLHNEELIDLYSSPNILYLIKSRRNKRVGQVACMGQERFIQSFDGKS
jgi:hypothetical protein